jgi:hypothetical protein
MIDFPILPRAEFEGSSDGGADGDCLQMLDADLGVLPAKLDELGIRDNTIVIAKDRPTPNASPPLVDLLGIGELRQINPADDNPVTPLMSRCQIPSICRFFASNSSCERMPEACRAASFSSSAM